MSVRWFNQLICYGNSGEAQKDKKVAVVNQNVFQDRRNQLTPAMVKKYEAWRQKIEANDEYIKSLTQNMVLRFFTGYRYEIPEVEKRLFTFLDFFKTLDMKAIELDQFPNIHKHSPFYYLGMSKRGVPVFVLKVKRFFPFSLPFEDLKKYMTKFFFTILEKQVNKVRSRARWLYKYYGYRRVYK